MNITITKFTITAVSPTTYKVAVQTQIQFKAGEEKRTYRIGCFLKAQDSKDIPPGPDAEIGAVGWHSYPGNNPPSPSISPNFSKSFAKSQLNEDPSPGATDEVYVLIRVINAATGKPVASQTSNVIVKQF
jgi:hypothetical protein